MIIINGNRYYKRQIDAAQDLGCNGWDRYDGQNWQWYTLLWNPECNLVILDANNSGDCYGDYRTRYWESPAAFAAEFHGQRLLVKDWRDLVADSTKDDPLVTRFVSEIIGADARAC